MTRFSTAAFLLTTLLLSCSTPKKQTEEPKLTTVEDVDFSEQQYVLITLETDTVNLGDTVRGKMYLNSKELLSIPKANKVKNYLSIEFKDNYKAWGDRFNQTGTIENDTAYFEFIASPKESDSLDLNKRIFGGIYKIRFYPNTLDLDTAFVDTTSYFVRK